MHKSIIVLFLSTVCFLIALTSCDQRGSKANQVDTEIMSVTATYIADERDASFEVLGAKVNMRPDVKPLEIVSHEEKQYEGETLHGVTVKFLVNDEEEKYQFVLRIKAGDVTVLDHRQL